MSLQLRNSPIARPILALEFSTIVRSLWKSWKGSRRGDEFTKIGIAISGGPDSMALAHLCKQLIVEEFMPYLQIRAFIVDHRSREGSKEEACKVAGWMNQMGLTSKVITLQWPEEVLDPSIQSNFETLARRLRYQALGKACLAENIQALFLGHHRDDNIETGCIRLAQGHGRFGITGFDCVSPIPECHNLWGVSRSGDVTTLEAIRSNQSASLAPHIPEDVIDLPTYQSNIRHSTATGGVHIFRPLRPFPKSRLELTCRISKIPFVIDPTNADHTLTIRNTVRKLLSSGDLPRALQPCSILDLIEKNRNAKERLQGLVDDFVKMIHVLNFDFQAGTLLIRLPLPKVVKYFDETSVDRNQTQPYIHSFDVLLMVVRRLIGLVSTGSDSQISNRGLARAANLFWPQTLADAMSDVFTLGSVKFQPLKKKRTSTSADYFLKNFKRRVQADLIQGGNSTIQDTENIWLLSREPFRNHLPLPRGEFRIYLPRPKNEKLHKSSEKAANTSAWTQWKLWDGRYWARLRLVRQNKLVAKKADTVPKSHVYGLGDSVPITMRPATPGDLTSIELTTRDGNRNKVSRLAQKQLDRLLARFAPGDIRQTIPILSHAVPQPVEKKTANHLTSFSSATHGTFPQKHAKGALFLEERDDSGEGGKEHHKTYKEDENYDMGDTPRILAAPSFNWRTTGIIWVRMPRNPPGASASLGMESGSHQDEAEYQKVDTVVPWTVEWEIVYKFVDPVMIRNMTWEKDSLPESKG
ncbi:hypothetical protein LOZ12_003273 [Ophidiomyces ophidiicola]|uniref:Uncharacterized protein n=1 Tax=Ophidiomyces ophidiicola TaxID=1387563 RepID=A0ACB8UWZ5_9EURO|nr:hypothetical protein LOZ64_003667 [Ophidiomyces ophidiicola]KAI1917784.1 hypothetical protein LOZ61_000404 [Ophidiomyces ophidiicola]KAI1922722.1 hypothetical protein LOZ60_005585 [Ophidiomyces ophidiicola]KAI1946882.1 hypothetical protein LOZ62_003176 [Ophidiomyces ophidiicola]KAI1957135.1 hypothetical protein LOZ59_003994 [Ophidiomyces ophidiicola]